MTRTTEPAVQGEPIGCRTGNGKKLSSSQAEPGQAIKSDVASFPSISCATSWRRSRYNFSISLFSGKSNNMKVKCIATKQSTQRGAVVIARNIKHGILHLGRMLRSEQTRGKINVDWLRERERVTQSPSHSFRSDVKRDWIEKEKSRESCSLPISQSFGGAP